MEVIAKVRAVLDEVREAKADGKITAAEVAEIAKAVLQVGVEVLDLIDDMVGGDDD